MTLQEQQCKHYHYFHHYYVQIITTQEITEDSIQQ